MDTAHTIELSRSARALCPSYTSSWLEVAISVFIRPFVMISISLVTFSSFSNPRRMADGLDLNRLILIIAVLEKHGGLKLSSFDVFINVSGGFRINETAADLAVAMAITSSLKDRHIPGEAGFLGEISLSGEIRPVSQCSKRVQEFKLSGFNKIL